MVSRERIYSMLTNDDENDKVATWYNRIMVVVIVLCLIPLWFKKPAIGLIILDHVCVSVFIIDYLMRWATADLKLKRGKVSFILYPFTPMALMDLLSILPSFAPLSGSLRAVRILRVLGALRAFKLFRHSRTIHLLRLVGHNQRQPLLVGFVLALVYVVVCATVMFNVEPDTFDTFLNALYWSVISLTTIGYGDFYPASEIGRIVAMISAFVGIAIIALPSGIIAAGFMDELSKQRHQPNFLMGHQGWPHGLHPDHEADADEPHSDYEADADGTHPDHEADAGGSRPSQESGADGLPQPADRR